MYQYSLAYYTSLFGRCILDSEKNSDLETRLHNILEYATLVIYTNICRGLFEKDKLLFSSSICFQILRQSHEIGDMEWGLFLRGPGALDKSAMPSNPFPEAITTQMWDLLCAMETRCLYNTAGSKLIETTGTTEEKAQPNDTAKSTAKAAHKKASSSEDEDASSKLEVHHFSHATPFVNLCKSIKEDYAGRGKASAWATFMESDDCMSAELPGGLQDTVNIFQRLLLVKALREDKLQVCIAKFVEHKLGRKFAENPSTSMEVKLVITCFCFYLFSFASLCICLHFVCVHSSL